MGEGVEGEVGVAEANAAGNGMGDNGYSLEFGVWSLEDLGDLGDAILVCIQEINLSSGL